MTSAIQQNQRTLRIKRIQILKIGIIAKILPVKMPQKTALTTEPKTKRDRLRANPALPKAQRPRARSL